MGRSGNRTYERPPIHKASTASTAAVGSLAAPRRLDTRAVSVVFWMPRSPTQHTFQRRGIHWQRGWRWNLAVITAIFAFVLLPITQATEAHRHAVMACTNGLW